MGEGYAPAGEPPAGGVIDRSPDLRNGLPKALSATEGADLGVADAG